MIALPMAPGNRPICNFKQDFIVAVRRESKVKNIDKTPLIHDCRIYPSMVYIPNGVYMKKPKKTDCCDKQHPDHSKELSRLNRVSGQI